MLAAQGHSAFIEISPHPVLTASVQATLPNSPATTWYTGTNPTTSTTVGTVIGSRQTNSIILRTRG